MKKSINKGSITIVCACVCVRNRRKTFSNSYLHFYYLKSVSRLSIRVFFSRVIIFFWGLLKLTALPLLCSSGFPGFAKSSLLYSIQLCLILCLGVLIYQFVVFFSKHSICLCCFCLKEFCRLSQKFVLAEHFFSKSVGLVVVCKRS